MGVNFTPKAPKPSAAEQIAALEAQVSELKETNAANERLLNTLLGVVDDAE